jgi:hypothetical protein
MRESVIPRHRKHNLSLQLKPIKILHLHRAGAKIFLFKLQVLKGHIALDTAVFPNGTNGML